MLSRERCRNRPRVTAVAVALVAGGMLAACSSQPKTKFTEAEYGVAASPRVFAGRGPVPKGGGRYMVGKPYRVAGRTYVPRDDPNYRAVGLASWYGPNFHGRKTANGEVYDMRDITAAHPTMPLPSYARVTNLKNGRSVVVRVNDRGPFKRGRVIDVSSTAADMLDFKRTGVAKVRVEYVGPARMDGRDRQMLMATYREPGQAPAEVPVMVAAAQSSPANTVRVASVAPPAQRTVDFGIADRTMAIAPTPASRFEDPLGPLILQTGFASSYLPTDRFTPAHNAAAQLATAGTQSDRPVAALDAALSNRRIVQLASFADRWNAERARTRFARYGRVILSERDGLTVVSVVTTAAGSAEVIRAAGAAGLAGAFVVDD